MKFKELYGINVEKNVEKKGRFKYLSWAHAWKWFVEQYPNATYEVLKDESNNCYFGNKDTGYMVYTKVTAGDLTHEMWLPVMDHNNKAIKSPDMMAINKAVMRCLVKNLAMFGLGLYIYAGEDLPNEEDTPQQNATDKTNHNNGISESQVKRLNAIAWSKGYNFESVSKTAKSKYGVTDLNTLTKTQYDELCKGYEGLPNAKK